MTSEPPFLIDEGFPERVWLVSIDSLNTLRAKRESGSVVPDESPEVSETVPEAMRDLALRLETRASEAAELRTQLELTEITQSTLEAKRNRLQESLRRAEEEAKSLRQELDKEWSKGFWQRLLGS